MASLVQRRWRQFWAVFCVALLVVTLAHGALITLVAKVSYALLNAAGNTPLADGSVVYIIGSGDTTFGDGTDQMARYGQTNYFANSVLGDDVFIGLVRIGENTSSNGTFLTAKFEFDDTEVNYLYIRFFDTTNEPPCGYTNWNYSPMFEATNHPFGVEWIDFVGKYATTNMDNFVVIPEPASGQLLLLLGGLVWGMRLSMRKRDDE